MASNITDRSEEAAIDLDVISGCCAGNRDAQRCLYQLCHQQVYRLMVRMVGLQDAEDLTQQVFVQLFRRIGQFAGHSKFETWLYRLAMNESLQHLRRIRRWDFQPLTFEPQSDTKLEQERDEQTEILELALKRLNPELRAIFILREIEELSYRDIAQTIDIPEGTVGSRLNRARRELQQHLLELGWRS